MNISRRKSALAHSLPGGVWPVMLTPFLDDGRIDWAGATGRFLFMKDTCCRLGEICAKLAAIRGAPVCWYNAHCPTLLASLQAGGDGYCGIAANFFPKLYVWLCQHAASHPEAAQRLQHFLSVADMAVRHKYPTSAKIFLARSGVPIQPISRAGTADFTEDELLVLDHLREAADEMAAALPHASTRRALKDGRI